MSDSSDASRQVVAASSAAPGAVSLSWMGALAGHASQARTEKERTEEEEENVVAEEVYITEEVSTTQGSDSVQVVQMAGTTPLRGGEGVLMARTPPPPLDAAAANDAPRGANYSPPPQTPPTATSVPESPDIQAACGGGGGEGVEEGRPPCVSSFDGKSCKVEGGNLENAARQGVVDERVEAAGALSATHAEACHERGGAGGVGQGVGAEWLEVTYALGDSAQGEEEEGREEREGRRAEDVIDCYEKAMNDMQDELLRAAHLQVADSGGGGGGRRPLDRMQYAMYKEYHVGVYCIACRMYHT